MKRLLQAGLLAAICVALCEAAPSLNATGLHWGVLVAGSNGWFNYRHQADICHAYQILHKNGIPNERIIVFMYDDIAYNEENPNPGVIINKPDGPNVYPGVPKDYTGEDVTPQNFLAVLTGDSAAVTGGSGKVLKSGPNDHVFVYFSDHGAPDLIAFPSDELYDADLLAALQKMYDTQMYSKLVFYLEACESGSMFVNLSSDINIYATTAANPHESSYGYYCDNPLDTCLGDEYSIRWMEDSDAENLKKESLQKQFRTVKSETTESHVQEYGDQDFIKDKVFEFQGGGASDLYKPQAKGPRSNSPFNVVPSREIEMTMLHKKLRNATDLKERDQVLQKIIKAAEHQRNMIHKAELIVNVAVGNSKKVDEYLSRPSDLSVRNKKCYQQTVSLFSDQCFRLGQNEFATGLLHIFSNMCNDDVSTERILKAIQTAC